MCVLYPVCRIAGQPNLTLYGLGGLNSLTAYAAPSISASVWTLGLVGTASFLLVIFFKIVPYFQRCRNCAMLAPPMQIPAEPDKPWWGVRLGGKSGRCERPIRLLEAAQREVTCWLPMVCRIRSAQERPATAAF